MLPAASASRRQGSIDDDPYRHHSSGHSDVCVDNLQGFPLVVASTLDNPQGFPLIAAWTSLSLSLALVVGHARDTPPQHLCQKRQH